MLPFRLPLRLATQTRLTTTLISRPLLARRVLLPYRSYATPAKPKKGSIGETAKRGRATKTTTPKKTPKKTTTTKATTKKTKTDSSKPPSKTALAKAAAHQRKLDRTAAAKAKKAALAKQKRAKEKSKREATKPVTPSAKIRALKEQALSPPPTPNTSTWLAFYQASMRQNPDEVKVKGKGGVTNYVKQVKSEYDTLSPSEKESYTRAAKEERANKEREYAAWVGGKSAEEIRLANEARKKLRALKVRGYGEIKDERKLTRPPTAYVRFSTERARSGQHGGTFTEQAKESARSWKELSQTQKQDYIDAFNRDMGQYEREYEKLYGHPAPSVLRKKSS
ncbi:hypothetical protein BDZ85DRAFT_251705 [Elsinoe ampelina]|uniref:HMG box domain-containing protein n=1 Tax=Elsinoe ampelina TaxID=302913 RepID=A0A6A6G6L3_9PEZI|nr:hypothetical protein BDZ85DRAFT_251705 [Elsinoe ampelina]